MPNVGDLAIGYGVGMGIGAGGAAIGLEPVGGILTGAVFALPAMAYISWTRGEADA